MIKWLKRLFKRKKKIIEVEQKDILDNTYKLKIPDPPKIIKLKKHLHKRYHFGQFTPIKKI